MFLAGFVRSCHFHQASSSPEPRTNASAAWQGGNGSSNAYRYAGEYGYYRDSAAVQYVRARYLNVVQGRWMSADPLRFEAGDYNLYRYVGNEPLGRMDASGLWPECTKPQVIFWIGDNPFYHQIFLAVIDAVSKINGKGKYEASVAGRSWAALRAANTAPKLAGLYTSAHGGCGAVPFNCDWCYTNPLFGGGYSVWSKAKRSAICQRFYRKAPNDWVTLRSSSLVVFKQLSHNHCVGARTSADVPRIESWLASRLGVPSAKVKLCRQSEDFGCESNFQDHYDALKNFEALFL